jgi:hypothetical protein
MPCSALCEGLTLEITSSEFHSKWEFTVVLGAHVLFVTMLTPSYENGAGQWGVPWDGGGIPAMPSAHARALVCCAG